jgi:two-component system, NarL family, sensor kinase
LSGLDDEVLPGFYPLGENRLLRRIIEVTSSDLKVKEVVQHVAALVAEATGSDVCFVHVLDDERNRIVLMGATPPFSALAGTVELALGEGVAGWVALNAKPAVVPDKWKDDRYRYIPALRGEDYESMASVPMLVRGGRVVGVLNVHSRKPRAYGDNDLALLTQVANLTARTVENARLYERLAERERALERFAARTVETEEVERRRLAGEIHDGISQRLISLWYRLQAAGKIADGPALIRELEAAMDLTSAALDETRRAIVGLRPSVLDDLGLGPSLESLATTVSGPDVELQISPCRLPAHVEMALYRIAQEALQNVVKHAGAERVFIRLSRTADGVVHLVVEDDGRGFAAGQATNGETPSTSYGLVGMRERAELVGAHLTINSVAGSGTRVRVDVPDTDPAV